MGSLLKFVLPSLLIVVFVSVLVLHRGSLLPSPLLPRQSQEPAPSRLAAELVGNLSRVLAGVEARADSLEADMRHLGATTFAFSVRERRQQVQRRLEQRENCEAAWWWWRAVLLASVRNAETLRTSVKHLQQQQEDSSQQQQEQQDMPGEVYMSNVEVLKQLKVFKNDY